MFVYTYFYMSNYIQSCISIIFAAQKFIISTCVRYVDNTDFVNILEDYYRYKVEIFRVN